MDALGSYASLAVLGDRHDALPPEALVQGFASFVARPPEPDSDRVQPAQPNALIAVEVLGAVGTPGLIRVVAREEKALLPS